MKPISEYNFRDIVGKFVRFKSNSLGLKYDEYIGYCYIDPNAGISIRVLSAIIENKAKALYDISIVLRYDSNMNIDIYTTPDKYMAQQKSFIDNIYSNNLLESLRNRTELDPYRKSAQYPDDIFIRCMTFQDNKIQSDDLWIKLDDFDDNNIFGTTIEGGKYINKDVRIWIMNSNIFKNDSVNELGSFVGMDLNIIFMLQDQIKEVTNDIQET